MVETISFAWPFALAALVMVALALAFVAPKLLDVSPVASVDGWPALHVHAAQAGAIELERALAAGEWSEASYAQARSDLERALLRDAPAPAAPARAASRSLGWAVCVGLPLVATLLYLALGEPAALRRDFDLPPQSPTLAASDLARHLEQHPRDARAWVLLARTQAQAGGFADAAQSYARAVSFPNVARDASIWSEYADALGMAQGGRLVGRPVALIEEALRRDPTNPQALELAGSAAYEQGDFRRAAQYWRLLLAGTDGTSPQRGEIAAAIARAERRAASALPIGLATPNGVPR